MAVRRARKTNLAGLLLLLSSALASAQDSAAPSSRLLSPVYPETAPGLSAYEGEDAVSTNMATQSTLNYGCSGNRALQLSRQGRLPGGSPYYAEYCVFVESAGTYELWYGGTPPGPADELFPSYASPIAVSIDGGPARALRREDVNVVERYAPAYYWVRTFAAELEAGAHTIRFEVSEKRRLDDRYFFYLDSFFLATGEALAARGRTGYPEIFPKDPADRRIDNPYRGFEEYQSVIQSSPSLLEPYIELADAYSLAGDYLNALRILARASLIAPRDERVRLLMAKNRIWRGDVKEGLEAYGVYLSLRPDDLGAYEEAGKVAAWSGRFSDSEYFYSIGLSAFPEELSLVVNLGMTLLWAGRGAEAEVQFERARKLASADPELSERLAAIYRGNGLPELAAEAYERAIGLFPDRLGSYLQLGSLYAAEGQEEKARAVEERISAAFEPSARLDAVLAEARARRELKANRIAELEARIAESPRDLDLKEELARVYSWNGRKAEAAAELESILAARFARELSGSDARHGGILSQRLAAAALRAEAEDGAAALEALRSKAVAALAAADKAVAALAAREAAEAAGKAPPGSAAESLASADTALALARESSGLLASEAARLSLVAARADASRAALDAALAPDSAEEEAFRALAEGQDWSFDAAESAAELERASARGDELAALGRSRVLASSSKDMKAALAALGAVRAEALEPEAAEARLRITARRDYRAIRDAARAEGAVSALKAAAAELALVEAASPETAAPDSAAPEAADPAAEAQGFGILDSAEAEAAAESARAELAAALEDAQAAKSEALRARALLVLVERDADAADDLRIERAWHSFETEAADLRSDLGSYYDELGMPSRATGQYRRVLALDRTNLRAMYSLALAEDKAGDWAAAASLFKSVHGIDPYYLNAAALHNAIARRHAPRVEVDTSFLADLNLFDYRSRASSSFPLGSALSIEGRAEVRSIRDRNLGFPAFISAALGLGMPISLSGGELVIRPSGSLIATSADFSSFGIGTSSPGEFAETLSLYSSGGASIDWARGQLRAGLDYSYAPVPDSLNPAFAAILALAKLSGLYAHRAELTGSAYFPMSGAFRYLAPRVYASGGYVPADDGNIYGTALLEIIPALRLSDSPWANLGFPAALVLEHSKEARISPYYAADGSLTAKAGILYQSSFSLSGGNSLSLSAQAMGGLFQDHSFSDSSQRYLYLSAFARAEWAQGDTTFFASLEASATDPFASEPAYWSFAIAGGIALRRPGLIAH